MPFSACFDRGIDECAWEEISQLVAIGSGEVCEATKKTVRHSWRAAALLCCCCCCFKIDPQQNGELRFCVPQCGAHRRHTRVWGALQTTQYTLSVVGPTVAGFDAIRQNAFIDLAIEEATELYAGSTVRFAFVRLFRSIICDHQSNGCDLRGGSKFFLWRFGHYFNAI